MKTSHTAACAAIICALGATTTGITHAQQATEPSVPIGALNAFPTIVYPGTHPVVTWGIDYPQTIHDIVTIGNDGTITTKDEVTVETRLVKSTGAPLTNHNGSDGSGSSSSVYVTFDSEGGSLEVSSSKELSNVVLGFTDGTHYKFDNLSGYNQTFAGIGVNAGKTIATVWVKSGDYASGDGPGYGYRFESPIAGATSVNIDVQFRADDTGSWNSVYYGSQNMVNPTRVEHVQSVRKHHKINTRARMDKGGWGGWLTTGTGNPHSLVLTAGDSLPANLPEYKRTAIANSLQPYINSAGRASIGPKEVLILFELEETDVTARNYDLSDTVMLLSFSNPSKSAGIGSPEDGFAPFATYEVDPALDDATLGGGLN